MKYNFFFAKLKTHFCLYSNTIGICVPVTFATLCTTRIWARVYRLRLPSSTRKTPHTVFKLERQLQYKCLQHLRSKLFQSQIQVVFISEFDSGTTITSFRNVIIEQCLQISTYIHSKLFSTKQSEWHLWQIKVEIIVFIAALCCCSQLSLTDRTQWWWET